ncbi:hypothetical protein AX15_006885 [Amanita polypyramis BW_CC]|nr:hypothetical protein AX15_006885 [Amanita polypyramis BW_CC]
MICETLLSTVLLALALVATANPIAPRSSYTKLSLSRHLNFTGVHNVMQRDQARVRQLLAKANGQHYPSTSIRIDEPITNQIVTYVASVGVGTPPTTYNLIVDTGSSNTWVGADRPYAATSTSQQTKDNVSITYGSGYFSGIEYIDTVTLGSLVITNQSIGVATNTSGFSNLDGILGIGPIGLTNGTLLPDSSKTIPTVTDNAFAQGKISANKIGISFEPTTSISIQNGEISWGDVDNTKYTGEINYVPVTSGYPASQYWGIDGSIAYGSATILPPTAGIVDTGRFKRASRHDLVTRLGLQVQL